MISILGSLSFAKLVVMSSSPAKSVGMPDTRPKIHSFMYWITVVPYNLDSNLYLDTVLTTSNAINVN